MTHMNKHIDHLLQDSAYLPGESPFSSNKIPSPETPVKLVFIKKSSSVAPSIGRMASHSPLKHSITLFHVSVLYARQETWSEIQKKTLINKGF